MNQVLGAPGTPSLSSGAVLDREVAYRPRGPAALPLAVSFQRAVFAARFYSARCMLYLWHPDFTNCVANAKKRAARRLYFRATGIVRHDEALGHTPVLQPAGQPVSQGDLRSATAAAAYYYSQCMFCIWEPSQTNSIRSTRLRARARLFHHAMGIVQYDRALVYSFAAMQPNGKGCSDD